MDEVFSLIVTPQPLTLVDAIRWELSPIEPIASRVRLSSSGTINTSLYSAAQTAPAPVITLRRSLDL